MPDDRLDRQSPNPPSSPVVADWLRSPEVPLPELDPRSLSSRPLLEPLMPLSSSTPNSGLTSSSSGRPVLPRFSLRSVIVSSYKVGLQRATARPGPCRRQDECQRPSMFTIAHFSLPL